MQGPYMSGPLPHSIYLSAAGGSPAGSFLFGGQEDRSGAGSLLRPAFGTSTVVDDKHVGTRVERDAAGYCAEAIRGSNVELWTAELSEHRAVVAVLNRSPNMEEMEVEWSRPLKLDLGAHMSVRNVWGKSDEGVHTTSFKARVNGHGATLLVLTPGGDA